jgi:DNA-binding NarL/FixJ family response regulator
MAERASKISLAARFGEATIAIRVQLGTMPAMLGDIVVHLLAESAEVELVGRTDEGHDALDLAAKAGADLLIVRDDDDGAIAALRALPNLSILWIASDGHRGTIARMGQSGVTLDRASVGRIASSILGHNVAGHA